MEEDNNNVSVYKLSCQLADKFKALPKDAAYAKIEPHNVRDSTTIFVNFISRLVTRDDAAEACVAMIEVYLANINWRPK